LAKTAEQIGYDAQLLRAVEAVNERQKGVLFDKLQRAFDGDLEGRTIALWGLAFKPNTDDMREAPSRALIEALWSVGARVRAFDPESMKETRRIYGERDDLYLATSQNDALDGADALVICTEWKQFRTLDFNWLKTRLGSPVLVDGRNLFDPSAVKAAGLLYYAVGRADSLSIVTT
jgi:UDPglucose 6-dehydrogenase